MTKHSLTWRQLQLKPQESWLKAILGGLILIGLFVELQIFIILF